MIHFNYGEKVLYIFFIGNSVVITCKRAMTPGTVTELAILYIPCYKIKNKPSVEYRSSVVNVG